MPVADRMAVQCGMEGIGTTGAAEETNDDATFIRRWIMVLEKNRLEVESSPDDQQQEAAWRSDETTHWMKCIG